MVTPIKSETHAHIVAMGGSMFEESVEIDMDVARDLTCEEIGAAVKAHADLAHLARAFDVADRVHYLNPDLEGFRDSEYQALADCKSQHDKILRAFELLDQWREHQRSRTANKKHVKQQRRVVASGYAKIFVAVGRRDGFQCANCKLATRDLQIDHIVPVTAGGESVMENYQLLCRTCNGSKGASIQNSVQRRYVDEFEREIQYEYAPPEISDYD